MHAKLKDAITPTRFQYLGNLGIPGAEVSIAYEGDQHTGSFKFRAAYNVAINVPHNHIITASSGNFGQALAYACKLVGKTCTVVMPDKAAKMKIQRTESHGARVELIDTSKVQRAERLAQLRVDHPDAYIASPYDDKYVIQGNASLGREIVRHGEFDFVVAPIGGGGLTAGLIQGIKSLQSPIRTRVIAAEPSMADDAYRSFKAGRLIANESEPQTIADGARSLRLGSLNWHILKTGLHNVIRVSEDEIIEGVRTLNYFLVRAEPTAALSIGALRALPEQFEGKKICCVVSGRNVDEELFRKITSERAHS